MKQFFKTLLILVILLGASFAGAMAASLDDIFHEYKKAENAEYITVPRFLLSVAGKLHKVPSIAGKVNGLRVLDISNCSETQRKEFKNRFTELSAGYETLLTVKEDGEDVRIITKPQGKNFKNIYIMTIDQSDICLVKIGGVFTEEDLTSFMNDKKKKND